MPMTVGNRGKSELDRQFEIISERTSAGHRIEVAGEMDLSVIGELDREVREAEASDSERIVLDLRQLEFMDAAGIRLLLELDERAKGNGRRLRIKSALSPAVRRVFELTGVGEILPFEA
jgi:anti-sigma B factor antagonist